MQLTIKRKSDGSDISVHYSPEHHDLISQFNWYISMYGYVNAYDRKIKKSVTMGRIILGLDREDKRMADHINGNRLDNRIENLRACDRLGNCRNKRKYKNSRYQYKGIAMVKNGKFKAVICANYKLYHLGTYNSDIEAAKAYDAAARYFHGEFARTNFK